MLEEILMNLNPYLMYINNSVSNAIVSTPVYNQRNIKQNIYELQKGIYLYQCCRVEQSLHYRTSDVLKSIIIIEDLVCSIQNYSELELQNSFFVRTKHTKIIGEFLI